VADVLTTAQQNWMHAWLASGKPKLG